MELRKVLTMRGPNIWTTKTVIEAWLDLEANETTVLGVPGIDTRLNELCTTIHGKCGEACGNGSEVLPFHAETSVARLIARTASEFQVALGYKACFVRAVTGNEPKLFKIAVEYNCHEELARACVNAAYEFISAAMTTTEYDVAGKLAELRTLASECCVTPGKAAILTAARAKGVPVMKLPGEGMLQFGWGVKQRRMLATSTDRASAIATAIADDVEVTNSLLRSVGVPTLDRDDHPAPVANYSLLIVGQQLVAAMEIGLTENGSVRVIREVTFDVHLDTIAQAVDAGRIVGLEMAQVNIASADIRQPLGGDNAVVNVSAKPNLNMFCEASAEAAQRIGMAVVDSLFPGQQNGRIPVVTITGVNGKTTTTRFIAHMVTMSGKRVGMTCTDGIYVAGRRIDHDDCSGPKSARNVLMNPTMDAAVLETARGGILREGLAVDRCDVAVVMNIGEGDHLGLNDIKTPEQLAVVKRTIVTAVAKSGAAVLKADDPLVADMANHCPGSVVFFCLDGDHPVMAKHRSEGGRVVFVRDHAIVLAEGSLEIPLLSLDRVPLTHKGRIGFQVENALAATAANWSIGTPCEIIRIGLETFGANIDSSPGRFNLLEIGGAAVVVDYGHNTSSLAAMLQALSQFPHQRRLAVYSAAGDRRDSDMVAQGEMLGDAFDRVYLYEDQYTRGREPGEIMARFHEGLSLGDRVKDVVEVKGWAQAAEDAIKSLRHGDLLLLQADTIDEAVDLVHKHLATDPATHEVDLNAALHTADEPGKSVPQVPSPHVPAKSEAVTS